MANKRSSAGKLMKSVGMSFLWLALLPAAAALFTKHSSIKFEERDAYLYTFGKRKSPGKAVFITNQTPSSLAKTAVKGFFKIKNQI